MKFKKKRDVNYWLRKIYTSKIYQFFHPNNLVLKKKVFSAIYKSNHWAQSDNLPGEKVSASGPGSNVNMKGFINLKISILFFINCKLTYLERLSKISIFSFYILN